MQDMKQSLILEDPQHLSRDRQLQGTVCGGPPVPYPVAYPAHIRGALGSAWYPASVLLQNLADLFGHQNLVAKGVRPLKQVGQPMGGKDRLVAFVSLGPARPLTL